MQVMKQTAKNQKYQSFSKKLKQMPVLNSYDFGTFIMLVYAANIGGGGGFNFETLCTVFNMLNFDAKERSQNHGCMWVWLM